MPKCFHRWLKPITNWSHARPKDTVEAEQNPGMRANSSGETSERRVTSILNSIAPNDADFPLCAGSSLRAGLSWAVLLPPSGQRDSLVCLYLPAGSNGTPTWPLITESSGRHGWALEREGSGHSPPEGSEAPEQHLPHALLPKEGPRASPHAGREKREPRLSL